MTTPQDKGRYGGYDVLAEADHWDATTRDLVQERLKPPGPLQFFTAAEARTLQAFLDIVLAQDGEPRIPVLAMVDAKFTAGKGDGFRYDNMPSDADTWRQVAEGLDRSAFPDGGGGFSDATEPVQHGLIEGFQSGTLHGPVWDQLPPDRAWSVVMRGSLSAFYSHPWAWNEIGFGGPAYPRGYARLAAGQRETWEAPESSYE